MANNNDLGVTPKAESLNSSESFLIKYSKQAVIAVVAVLVIVIGVFAYKQYYAEPREDKASTEMAKAQDYFSMGDFEKALNGDGKCAGFLKIASDYSGTDAANLAELYAGICYANLDKWKEAETRLAKYSTSDDAMVSPAALAALANAYAQNGSVDKAIDTFKKAAKLADKNINGKVNNSLSPVFLIQAATLLETQNKKAEALTIYQDIKAKYQRSMVVQSGEIERYINHLSE